MGIRSFVRSLFETDSEKALRIEAEEAKTLEDQQEYEEGLDISRRSFERENDHVPPEEYFSISSEALLRAIAEHRRALNGVLSHEELLDPYIADLETKIPERRNKKRLYNFLMRFPGTRASIDRIMEEVEE